MTVKSLRHSLLASFALGCASLAQADIVVTPTFDSSNQALLDTPPDTTDYEGICYGFAVIGCEVPTPPPSITIGGFNFTIPTGDQVVGATISGTFGDQNTPVTAVTDLFVENENFNVAGCDSVSDPCAAGTLDGSPVSWSHTFTGAELSELASDFAGGSLDFTAVQNSSGAVIVGAPTLDLQVATVPEPASIFTLAGGLLAIAALRRRK